MFFEQSTRARNSMEAGIAQLGGHTNYLDTSTMQVSHGEVAKDTAVILSRFGHGIACRNCFWGIGNKYIRDRKSTRLNSSHANISYAVFCLRKQEAVASPRPVCRPPSPD